MNFKYNLTDKVKEFIIDSKLEEIKIGCSDSQVIKIIKENNIYFLKMSKKGLITNEYTKLKWLYNKLNVPKVVLYDTSDNEEFLITEKVDGDMLCSKYYSSNPIIGLEVVREAFNKLWSLDIKDCPFDESIDYKLNLVSYNVNNNLIKDSDLSEETIKKFGSTKNVLKYLKENKFDDELCFSHGDTSLPNIFADKNKLCGFIDIGMCGICDKWFDIAITEKSIKRNYGEEYVSIFYDKIGVKREKEKVEYYLLMLELYL